MSNDHFTEITHESWFGRLGGAIKGVFAGFILFLISIPLLFWNEGRAVERYKTLKEGDGAVVSVAADTVFPANEAKLVHVTGRADTGETLNDSDFGVSATALKLDRTVEMYQWKETSKKDKKKKMGGGTETVTTYEYKKVWSEDPIQSSMFKKGEGHRNPESMPYQSSTTTARDVTLGAFSMPASLVAKIKKTEPLTIVEEKQIPEALKNKAVLHNGGFYLGPDPSSPSIGDLRVRFSIVHPCEVSVIAKQTGHTFAPYAAKAGGTIELLELGTVTAAAMIQQAQERNKFMTWMLRAAGFIVMFVGLLMILKPLPVFADVLPLLGSIVGAGAGVIAFLAAGLLSSITISIAWIFYRPLLGVGLLAVAAVFAVAIGGKLKGARAERAVD